MFVSQALKAREEDARRNAEEKAAAEREAIGRTHALKAVQIESDALQINIDELEDNDDDDDAVAS